ncbi:sulfur carrier protein ThiS [Synechococcus sp. ATX 2A4]|nr:sulfur carrier protein ThiS [Synechococcus sp. ATX 2A4]
MGWRWCARSWRPPIRRRPAGSCWPPCHHFPDHRSLHAPAVTSDTLGLSPFTPAPQPSAPPPLRPSAAVTLSLQLNGEARQCPAGLSLQEALLHFGYEPRLVVVEFNDEVLARRQWPEQPLGEGDVLEVVTIVGGGS